MRVLLAAALGILLASGAASGKDSPSRIVDRTLVCRATGEGLPDPLRVLDVTASSRAGTNAPRVNASNGRGSEGMSAGLSTGRFEGQLTGALWFSRSQCTTTSLRVALSNAGLRGGQAAAVGERHECEVPARVLIRVRAVFTRPVTPFRDPRATYLLIAKGKITSGSLAVTTVQGRTPIIFGSVDDATGKARISTSASLCHRE